MTFGEKLKKLRTTLGLTQVKFATLIKSSQGSIATWETGKAVCHERTIELLEKLCAKKGIKINWRR